MQRRWVFVLSWFTVTAVSVLIATQAVGAIRDAVTDTPATLPTIAAVDAVTTTTTTVAPTSTGLPETTAVPLTTLSTTTTTTVPPSSNAPETTTTAPPPTTQAPATTTAAPAAQMETATYQLTGGWVRIRYGGGEVYLVDAAPYAGFSMDVEKRGPSKVEVEFDGDDYEGKFKADVEDGPLDVDIDEGDEHDD